MTTTRLISVILALVMLLSCTALLAGCGGGDNQIVIYNWGQYMSDGSDGSEDLIARFEEETGYDVVLRYYESNEELYGLLTSGAIQCDLVIPSDYMIARLIEEGYLDKIDYANIPNYKYIMDAYKGMAYDPTDAYSVPYTWGTTCLIYNTKMVKEAPTSWNALWNTDYKGNVLMFRNSRDAFAIALQKLGYSINTTKESELRAAAAELATLKDNWQGLVMDETFEKMEGNNAAMAPYYAGDFITMQEVNPDLDYVHPVEGVNIFVDAMCIPTGARNKAGAEAFINYMLEPEIGKINIEYIAYSTPNSAVYDLLDEETKNNPAMYPAEDVLAKAEAFSHWPEATNKLVSELWLEVTNG